jgi:hypothetical protein
VIHLAFRSFRVKGLGDERQILDRPADAEVDLLGERDCQERPALPLPPCGNGKKVLILGEDHSPERRRALEQLLVRQFARAIIVRREDIDSAAA